MLYRSFLTLQLLCLTLTAFAGKPTPPVNTKGPLEGFDEYRVTLFVSPFSEFDSKEIASNLKAKLREIGEVRKANQNRDMESPLLLISLEGEDSTTPSSIRVIGKVYVQKNGYELTRVIWSYPHEQPSEDKITERDGLVSFPRNQTAPESSRDILDILTKAFIQEFELGNSPESRPVFLVSE
jgi:hypothetical protein